VEGDLKLSKLHFRIEYTPPTARLFDANSKNKTFVNGQQVDATDLHHGDEIQAGETALRVSMPVADPNQTIAGPETDSPAEGAGPGLLAANGLPAGLGRVICRPLSREPERRYRDARAMREALRRAL
jgi:hypothetical protein